MNWLPDNDFCWSFWADREEAKAELEGLINSLRTGVLPEKMCFAVLFGKRTGNTPCAGYACGEGRTQVSAVGQWHGR